MGPAQPRREIDSIAGINTYMSCGYHMEARARVEATARARARARVEATATARARVRVRAVQTSVVQGPPQEGLMGRRYWGEGGAGALSL